MNLTDLYDAILNGKLDRAVAVTNEAISEGVLPNEIITNYMIKAMEEIGNRFEAGKVFVPNLLMSARAMKGALDLLKPLLQGETDAYVGKIVIGTVKGDLHDIGKNLVASMFEGCGFEVVNLGVDVSSEKFVEAARTNNADIICMSALLTTTMNYMKVVVDDLKTAGLYRKDKVKSCTTLCIRVNRNKPLPQGLSAGFVTSDGYTYKSLCPAPSAEGIVRIPLKELRLTDTALLPIAYPTFLKQYFHPETVIPFRPEKIEKLELSMPGTGKPTVEIELGDVWLE